MSITSIYANFNGVNIASVAGVSILSTDPYKPPKRKLSIYNLARSERGKVNGAFFTEKQITVGIAIQRPTREQTEQAFDTLIALLQGAEKELVLNQSGGARRYTATLQDIPVRVAGGSYMELDLIFKCSDAFGYDTAYTTALNLTGITSSTRGDVVPFGGSAAWQQPVFTIYYSAISGGSAKSVVIGNNANGQQVTITRDWVSGNRLEIDSVNKTVKVNGVEVEYTGAIPEFAPGLGNWSYSDTFTTRTFNALITYYKRWV